MPQFIKKNLTLILAFLLPIILIIIVAVSAYVPSQLFSTEYNFVYITCDDDTMKDPYGCSGYLKERYTVNNNQITVNEILPRDFNTDGIKDPITNYKGRVFIHNTKENTSREISLEEAQKLNLNPLLTSPDGINISSNYDSGGGFLFFDGGSSHGYYLTKGKLRSKLNLINNNDRYYYQGNFNFLGWVLHE